MLWSHAAARSHWDAYSDTQRRYNGFLNEWDICSEWGDPPSDDEDYDDLEDGEYYHPHNDDSNVGGDDITIPPIPVVNDPFIAPLDNSRESLDMAPQFHEAVQQRLGFHFENPDKRRRLDSFSKQIQEKEYVLHSYLGLLI